MSNFYLKQMILQNFKGIASLTIDFQNKINTFIGVNGSGKSSILFALTLALSRLTGRIRSFNSNGFNFDESYIKDGTNESTIKVTLMFNGEPVSWKIGKQRIQFKQIMSDLNDLTNNAVAEIKDLLAAEVEKSIPIVVYYGVSRNVLDIPLKIRTKHNFDRLAAYDEALLKERSVNDFRVFFEWFRDREDIENQDYRDYSEGLSAQKSYFDPQLSAVRTAIEKALPGFSKLKIKRHPRLQMVVSKKLGDTIAELDINQLSDGEKSTLAMVGDLARRLAIANPAVKNPLEGDGIVLIDEIDLHLHPQWECEIVPRLREVFPNCQFIVTTHSPLVLSQQKADDIFVLNHNQQGDIIAEHPIVANGLTANEILNLLMNAPNMSPAIKDAIDKIYSAIEEEKWDEAANQIAKVRQDTGADIPELTKVETYLSLCREN